MRRSMTIRQKLFGAALIVASFGQMAVAQEEVPRVALYTDWSVFNPLNPKECFIASAPTQSTAKRPSGETYQARRGNIRFYVASRPGDGTKNEIAYTGGYPYKDGSTVSVKIGNDSFELFTEGEFAWPASPAEDGKIIGAMQRGSKATVTGISSRGNTTIDTFSLIGFTDALKDSTQRCEE